MRFARSTLTLLSIMASSAAVSSSSTNPVVAAAAAAFIDARIAPSKAIAAPSGLTSVELGYEVQREMLTSAAASARLGGRVGWKAGATNAGAQSAMGFGPFLGPVFGNYIVNNGGSVSLKSMGSFRANEAEFCFYLSDDLPKKETGGLWTEEEVWARVEAVAPAIEIAATRCSDSPLSPAAVLADFSLNGCCVIGPKIAPSALEGSYAALVGAKASLLVNSELAAENTGANVLGNPLTSLTWLANEVNQQGHTLRRGDLVMTGAAAASKALAAGDLLEARFLIPGVADELLRVSVKIEE